MISDRVELILGIVGCGGTLLATLYYVWSWL